MATYTITVPCEEIITNSYMPPFRMLSTIPSFRTVLYSKIGSRVWIPKVMNFFLLIQKVRPITGRASCCLIINIIKS